MLLRLERALSEVCYICDASLIGEVDVICGVVSTVGKVCLEKVIVTYCLCGCATVPLLAS